MRYPSVPRLIPLLLAFLITACSAPGPVLPGPPAAAVATSTPMPQVTAIMVTATEASAPTAVESTQIGPITDLDAFKTALLRVLMAHDTENLRVWMTEPFLTGGWRADGSDSAPQDALRSLYSDYLGADNHLEWVQGADLKALMGDIDPLSYPRAEAGVIAADLVSGWGKDGRDEAVLFIARGHDNSLGWHGWIVIPGGFSGARLGGSQPYTNAEHGYRVYLPKDYEIEQTNPSHVFVMAPGQGHPGEGRAAAFIDVTPAGGRTVEAITDQIKADLGPGFNIPPGTMLGLDKAPAIVLEGLPGQDVNRQLFVVYNDLLYHITFVPDTPKAGKSYQQMEDLYAMIVNTFHFTR